MPGKQLKSINLYISGGYDRTVVKPHDFITVSRRGETPVGGEVVSITEDSYNGYSQQSITLLDRWHRRHTVRVGEYSRFDGFHQYCKVSGYTNGERIEHGLFTSPFSPFSVSARIVGMSMSIFDAAEAWWMAPTI